MIQDIAIWIFGPHLSGVLLGCSALLGVVYGISRILLWYDTKEREQQRSRY